MKFVMLSELFPPSIGGHEVRFSELATTLTSLGHSVEVFCIAHDETVPHFEQIHPGVVVTRFPRLPTYKRPNSRFLPRSLSGMIRYSFAARRWMAHREFDAVIANQWPFFHILAMPRKHRKQTVIDWCEIRQGLVYRLAQSLLARMCGGNLAVSPAVRDYISGKSGKPTLLLPSGISPANYHAAPPAEHDGIVYLGRLSAHKGLLQTLAAYEALRRRGHTIRLTIAGDGPLRPAVEAAVRASPYASDIAMLGSVTEAQKVTLLARSRVLILLSEREGFPRVVAEAMASALPVVTSRHPGNGTAGIVEAADCGLSTDISPDRVADTIEAVLADWEAYSRNAAKAASDLAWRPLAVGLVAYLDTVIEASSETLPLSKSTACAAA